MIYYTAVLLLSWLALGVLCILVYENDRLSGKDKKIFYLTYFMVIFPSLAEWLGYYINGNASFPQWMLRTVKCADYVLTPFAAGAVVAQLRSRSIWQKMIWGIIAANAVFQIISAFNDWMIVIDAQNSFGKGPLYPVYTGISFTFLVLIGIEFVAYGKKFRRQNRLSLYATLGLVLVGVFIQEIYNEELRTDYLAFTLGMAALYIHNMEFSLIASDDAIHEQQVVITTDVLTGVLSRYAFEEKIKELDSFGVLPEKLTVFSMDVNSLKSANDIFGHKAGDELICGAASCIKSVFEAEGSCYRIGGDEFVVIAEMDRDKAQELLKCLTAEVSKWRGERVERLTMAASYALAADHPGYSCEKLIAEADKAMYAMKREYYKTIDAEQHADA